METDSERLARLRTEWTQYAPRINDYEWLCDQAEGRAKALSDLAECRQCNKAANDRIAALRTELGERDRRLATDATSGVLVEAMSEIVELRRRAEAVEALAGEMAVALQEAREAWRNTTVAVGRQWRDKVAALLATDAAQKALAKRERELAVISAALVWYRTPDPLRPRAEDKLWVALDALASGGKGHG